MPANFLYGLWLKEQAKQGMPTSSPDRGEVADRSAVSGLAPVVAMNGQRRASTVFLSAR
jgi:hypothetical protein